MNRLTQKGGDYCRHVCGQINTCPRARGARCGDALRYARLRQYEDTGVSPEEIAKMREAWKAQKEKSPSKDREKPAWGSAEAYQKEAEACEAELARLQDRLKYLQDIQGKNPGLDLRGRMAKYQEMAMEMKVKIKEFRRRAGEEG